MTETQKNSVTPQDGSSHHLKHHLQLKTKKRREEERPVRGGDQEKHI